MSKLLNDTSVSKFVATKWTEVNDLPDGHILSTRT